MCDTCKLAKRMYLAHTHNKRRDSDRNTRKKMYKTERNERKEIMRNAHSQLGSSTFCLLISFFVHFSKPFKTLTVAAAIKRQNEISLKLATRYIAAIRSRKSGGKTGPIFSYLSCFFELKFFSPFLYLESYRL